MHGGFVGGDMHIIVVSSRLAKPRSMTLSSGHFVLGGFAALALLVVLATGLLYVTIRYAAELKLPFLESMLVSVQAQQSEKAESFLRENLNAMAMKLGQMQAQLVRLDALGERVSSLSGLRPGEFRFSDTPGRGGAVSATVSPQNLSLVDL